MNSLRTGLDAGLDAWKQGPPDTPLELIQQRYAERQLMDSGELFLDDAHRSPWKQDPRVYRNISLLWNHTSRVNQFYGMMVYQGRLIAEPGMGAIPIEPDPSLTKDQVDELFAALDVIYRRWNWQRKMKLRPRRTAALGDCMTELVDDPIKRFPYPRMVWPGYITDIQLDYVGNVEAYRLEHMVTERLENGKTDTYRYTKVVTEEAFEFFRDGKPHGYDGMPASYRNPYGFVPAIWDQHIEDGTSVRGMSATDATRQMLFAINSLASHARDYQHKAFFAPVIVSGRMTPKKEHRLDLSAPQAPALAEEPSAMAQALQFIEAQQGASISQATFDIGQTLAQLAMIRDGILDTHPEITFFDKMAEQSQVSAPGADRIILPVKGLVEDARDGQDPNTVHLLQMAISIAGMRVNSGSWGSDLRNGREAFKPFTRDAYDQGRMAFTIKERPIVPPSRAELIEMTRQIEGIQTSWGMEQVGIDKTIGDQILGEKIERAYGRFNGLPMEGDE